MITLQFPHKIWKMSEDSIIILKGMKESDYWELSSEDIKIEYSGGCIFIHSPASLKHEELFGFLYRFINNYLERRNLGKMLGSRVAIELPNGHRPEPDLVFLPLDSYDPETDQIFSGVPPWVIEILSSGTKEHDLETKFEWYTAAQVKEIWYIDMDIPKLTRYWFEKDRYIKEEKIGGNVVAPLLASDLKINVSWFKSIPKLSEIL